MEWKLSRDRSRFHQTQKFRASGQVFLEGAEQTGGHHFTSSLADSATAHALVHRLDHHGYALRFENALQFRRDLIRQTFGTFRLSSVLV